MLTRHLATMILVTLAIGCGGSGYEVVRVIDHDALSRQHPDNLVGKSEAEVIEKLGEPTFRKKNADGGMILTYRDTLATVTTRTEIPAGSSEHDTSGRPIGVSAGANPAMPGDISSLDSVKDLKIWIGADGIVERWMRDKRKAVPPGARPAGD